jgi:hypothetical protein
MKVNRNLQGKINTIIMTVDNMISEHHIIDKETFLSDISCILCEFDTDIAIEVMEDFGEEGKYQAHSIRVNYGY